MDRRTWREAASAVISAKLAEGRALGLDGDELARFVSRAYPFGERAHYPYKVRLHECERQVKGENLPFSNRARQRRKRTLLEADADGQQWLFDPFGRKD